MKKRLPCQILCSNRHAWRKTNTLFFNRPLESAPAVGDRFERRSDVGEAVQPIQFLDNATRMFLQAAVDQQAPWLVHKTATVFVAGGCMDGPQGNITVMLRAAASGDRPVVDALMSAIYADLHRIANRQLLEERPDHTLQPTALVHEAYLKLVDQRSTDWKDRQHFFSIAARVIRRILVDHARERRAQKRGREYRRIEIETVELSAGGCNTDLIELDEALQELAELNARHAQVVEMRFFGGLTLEEVAQTLGIARRTVDREWAAARAWLYVRLSDSSESA